MQPKVCTVGCFFATPKRTVVSFITIGVTKVSGCICGRATGCTADLVDTTDTSAAALEKETDGSGLV